MNAIFDKNCRHVGWINQKDQMIFDTNMRWLGFIKNKYVFTSACRWVGGWIEGTLVDPSGRPVAWEQGYIPRGTLALVRPMTPLRPLIPLTPLRPLTPLTPLVPLTPLGGWSKLEWGMLWR